jgi:hypothetical protein
VHLRAHPWRGGCAPSFAVPLRREQRLPGLHRAAHGHLRLEQQRHELAGWRADARERQERC